MKWNIPFKTSSYNLHLEGVWNTRWNCYKGSKFSISVFNIRKHCINLRIWFFHTCKKWINKSLFTNINLNKKWWKGKAKSEHNCVQKYGWTSKDFWFDRTLGVTLKNTCVVSILCQWPTLMTPIQKTRHQIMEWTKKSIKKIICSQLGSCCLKNLQNSLIVIQMFCFGFFIYQSRKHFYVN